MLNLVVGLMLLWMVVWVVGGFIVLLCCLRWLGVFGCFVCCLLCIVYLIVLCVIC